MDGPRRRFTHSRCRRVVFRIAFAALFAGKVE
jgi:hypothetical protein